MIAIDSVVVCASCRCEFCRENESANGNGSCVDREVISTVIAIATKRVWSWSWMQERAVRCCYARSDRCCARVKATSTRRLNGRRDGLYGL